jgi:hypothetical protein
MDEIIDEILKSKKFSRLGKNYVKSVVKQLYDSEELSNKKEFKALLKKVKDFLHKTYTVYQISNQKKKEYLLGKILKSKSDEELEELHSKILHCHSSTRERKEIYSDMYEEIFRNIKQPKHLLDFGCGINVFSLPQIGFKNFEHIGMDTGKEDVKQINAYLKFSKKKYGFSGKGIEINAFEKYYFKQIPKNKFDVCFLLKMADVLDYGRRDHKKTEEFITKVNAKNIVVSFPTRTISNRKMNNPRRNWFELMIKRLKYKISYFELYNECFYIVNKN